MVKELEALIVPTGPGEKIDEQRAIAGANSYSEKSSKNLVDPYIIITGIYNDGILRGSQTEHIQEVLKYCGVPRDSILHENKSKNTRQNIIYTGEILRKELTDLAELNTDNWHAMRMTMLFQKAIQLGYAPKNLKVTKNTEGIDDSYPLQKAILAYFKDLILPLEKDLE